MPATEYVSVADATLLPKVTPAIWRHSTSSVVMVAKSGVNLRKEYKFIIEIDSTQYLPYGGLQYALLRHTNAADKIKTVQKMLYSDCRLQQYRCPAAGPGANTSPGRL